MVLITDYYNILYCWISSDKTKITAIRENVIFYKIYRYHNKSISQWLTT